MVESNEGKDCGFAFDDLMKEQKTTQAQNNMTAVQARQSYCLAKDLKKEDLPDFLKNQQANEVMPRMSIRDAVEFDAQDVELQAYKTKLLGNLQEEVKTQMDTGAGEQQPAFVEV